MDGTVTIICFNTNASSIVSAAGRISTIPGSADQIYRDSLGQLKEIMTLSTADIIMRN